MRLDVDKEISEAIKHFGQKEPSRILDHSKECCTIAREWFVALDKSFLAGGSILSGPRWIRLRWSWGPVKWPLYWCQIPTLRALDCGALAALARIAFGSRGLVTFPVQLIQRFSAQDAYHWSKKWQIVSRSPDWISGDLVYHEACAVIVQESQVKVWDPTDSCWISPSKAVGYGATVAACFHLQGPSLSMLISWEDIVIYPNVWIRLEKGGTEE